MLDPSMINSFDEKCNCPKPTETDIFEIQYSAFTNVIGVTIENSTNESGVVNIRTYDNNSGHVLLKLLVLGIGDIKQDNYELTFERDSRVTEEQLNIEQINGHTFKINFDHVSESMSFLSASKITFTYKDDQDVKAIFRFISVH